MRATGLYLVHDLSGPEPVLHVAQWVGDGPAGRWQLAGQNPPKVELQFTVLAGPLQPPPATDAASLERFLKLVEMDAQATNAPARRTVPINARFEFSTVRVCERLAVAAWLEEELPDLPQIDDVAEHVRRGERPKS